MKSVAPFHAYFKILNNGIFVICKNSTKLRERQKNRLAKRNSVEDSVPNGNVDQITEAANQDEESLAMMDLDDSKASQLCDALKRKASSLRQDSSSDPTPDLPSQQHHGAECSPSLPPNNLPVLGLCAPNFAQSEPSRRNYSRPSGKQNRIIPGPHFPFNLPQASSSAEREANNQEPSTGKLKPQNVKEEPSQQPLSNLDGWLPLRSVFPSLLYLQFLIARLLPIHNTYKTHKNVIYLYMG